MKANEIMVGDWVYNSHHKKPIQMTPYDFFTHSHTDGVPSFANILHPKPRLGRDLEPIPLTEEILKANADGGSCSFDEFRSIYHLKNNGYHREISIEFDKTWHVPFVEITGMGHTTIKVNMQYVHELQHALRLVGLNELADNFKLE